jgi:hypothetical protein
MVITNPNILEYLHDAIVLEVTYDLKDKESRSMMLSVNCEPDAGYPAWNGKQLSIRLESVVLLTFSAFGAVAGKERVNSWTATVSEAIDAELQRLQGLGVDCSGVRFAVAFQSGSVLEGLCQRITAEERSAPGEG